VNELALFAGIGGGILAGLTLGWTPICAVEISEYRRSVLGARQADGSLPTFPIWDDVRTFDGTVWRGRVDVVSGGFPCQAYSTATRGRSTADDLWPEMRRIVAEAAPRYVFAENVSKLAIDHASDELEEMGYETNCISLAASDLGADHVRRRFWLRAYAYDKGELLRSIDAKMAELPEFHRGIWESPPDGSRILDGVSNRMERFEATGDGQVPVVAAAAWRLMTLKAGTAPSVETKTQDQPRPATSQSGGVCAFCGAALTPTTAKDHRCSIRPHEEDLK
jgi:DNA (cytosine-5)-methyltransferase 1